MSNLTTLVKSIQDIMRQDAGVDGDAQRISQLAWMIFLKIFDDKEKEYELSDENYESPIPKKLRWRNWAADEEGITGDELLEFINNKLFKTLKDLKVNPDSDPKGFLVKALFEDSYNYMKSGTLIRQVVNKINLVDFNNLKERHIFNEIYEQILKDLQSAGNAGEYYTPRAVTQFMADMVNPQLGEVVFDPACGTGGFLSCALENMRRQMKTTDDWQTIQNSIRGVEKKPLPHLLGVTNLILHDIEVPAITHGNSLTRPLRDYTDADRVDVILTNPPFGGVEEPGIENNFPATFRTRETADLFLLLIIQLLKEKGRAALVLPDGFLFGEGAKTRIKERLLEKCNLHTIVRLPNGVFNPYTGIRTNLLFFTKGEPTEEIWYYELQYQEGIKSYNKTRPIHISEFDVIKKWWGKDTKAGRKKRDENQSAWRVSVKDIIANNYNLDIKNPNLVEEDHGDPEEILEKYNAVEKEIVALRDRLKNELKAALS
jgi:type I restriction enzyme M protein